MLQISYPPCRAPRAIAILLAVALLFAQWAGLSHRIDHGDLQYQLMQLSSATGIADDDQQQHVSHSCAAFDAATVGDSIHLLPFVTPLVTSAHVLALWAAFISWDAPVITHFCSRAPPPAC
ncbi:MAG: hypothetical protein V7606_4330 [Burkholderiales bacterium]